MLKALILSYLKSFKNKLALLILVGILAGATDGVIPFLIKRIFDSEPTQESISVLVILVVCFGFFRASVNLLYINLSSSLGHEVIKNLRLQLMHRIINLNPTRILQQGPSKTASMIINDATFLRELMVDILPSAFKETFRFTAILIATLYLNFYLSILGLIAIPVIALFVVLTSRLAKKYAQKAQQSLSYLTSFIFSALIGIKTIKSFQLENPIESKFKELNEDLKLNSVKADVFKNLSVPINEFLAATALGVLIWIAFGKISSEIITKGEFLGFLVSLFLLYDPVKKLSKAKSFIAASAGALSRLTNILAIPIENGPKIEPEFSNFNIELDNVSFEHEGKKILSGVNLFINQGSKVAIIGESGVGKSTLLDILSGFLTPTEGVVKLGGIPISDIPLEFLVKHITFASQSLDFFDALGLLNFGKEVSEEEIAKWLQKFKINNSFSSNFKFQEFGLSLSEGEKQRLMLIRVLLKKAEIYLFDEVTSALDPQLEELILKEIFAELRSKTVILVSHRPAPLKYADRILELKDCSLIERNDLLPREKTNLTTLC